MPSNEESLVMDEEQAYRAIIHFLERQYERTRSDDLAVLIGSATLLTDGNSADPALFDDWRACVRAATAGDRGSGQAAAE